MLILGVSAFYHDSAAAIIRDGEIIAAAQEERFTRKKHDAGFPVHAVPIASRRRAAAGSNVDSYCVLREALPEIRTAAGNLSRRLRRAALRSFRKAMPLWIGEKIFQRDILAKELEAIDPDSPKAEKLLFSEHHFSHAASAFYPSPFERAVVLTMDGVGEWTTTSADWATGPICRSSRRSISRTLSGCFTPR